MAEEIDFMSSSVDLFRKLSSAMLSCSQELLAANLDSAQTYVANSSRHLRVALSDTRSLQAPEHSAAAVQSGIRNTLEMTRDMVLTASECQMENLHLMQQQAAEAHQLLCDAFAPPLAAMQSTALPARRLSKASAPTYEHAA